MTIYNLARDVVRLSSSGSRIEHVKWDHPDVELRVPAVALLNRVGVDRLLPGEELLDSEGIASAGFLETQQAAAHRSELAHYLTTCGRSPGDLDLVDALTLPWPGDG